MILTRAAGEGDREAVEGRDGPDLAEQVRQGFVVQHGGCREAEHPHAARREPVIPRAVVRRLTWMSMALAVDLHRQLRLRTIEIQNVGADRMLTAKAKPVQPSLAQAVPENDLGEGHLAPKTFGALECQSLGPHPPPPP